MKTDYSGGCHCGKIRYQVTLDLGQVTSCNCSRCAKLGWFMAFAPLDDFKLLSGAEDAIEYQFNKRVISHMFCRICGIEPFARGIRPDGAKMVAIDVRCLEGVDTETLSVKNFNGRAL